MKRLLSLLIVICLLIPCLSSCFVNENSSRGIKMMDLNPWLKESDSSRVVRVERIHKYYGIEPNKDVTNYYSTDAEIIDKYIQWCSELKLVTTIPVGVLFGGGSTTHIFTFADGTTKEIFINQSVYTKSLISFKVSSDYDFDVSKMNRFYRFNVSEDGYSVFSCGDPPTLIKEVKQGASELGFIRCETEQNPETAPTYCLETSFGKILIYSDVLCYIDSRSQNKINGYYELYGATFSQLGFG